MNFKQESIKFGQTEVHLLKYPEFDPHLHSIDLIDDELNTFNALTHSKRQQEFVATRILRNKMLGTNKIHYNEIGAPYIETEDFISISHSNQVVSLATSKSFQVGLDIEKISDRILKISSKFVSDKESRLINIENPIELTKIWSAKEALYKISGTTGLNFKEDISVEQLPNGIWIGKIILGHQIFQTELTIFEKDNFIIALNTKACEKK